MSPHVHGVTERVGTIPQAETGMVFEERHHILRSALLKHRHKRRRVEFCAAKEIKKMVALEIRSPVLLVIRDCCGIRTATELIPVGIEARTLYVRAPRSDGPRSPVDENAKLRVDEPFWTLMRVDGRARRLVLPSGIHGIDLRQLPFRARHRLRRMVVRNLTQGFRIKYGLPILWTAIPFRGLRNRRKRPLTVTRQLVRRRRLFTQRQNRRKPRKAHHRSFPHFVPPRISSTTAITPLRGQSANGHLIAPASNDHVTSGLPDLPASFQYQ